MPDPIKSYQIVAAMSPELGREILEFLRQGSPEERQVFRASVARMAAEKKLRPVFIQRKSGSEQVEWLRGALSRKQGDGLAEHLLQVWLMNANRGMLTAFLDATGIPHEDGGIEDLPEALDPDKLGVAIDSLLAEFPPEKVAVYLHAFQLQRPGGWDGLTQELTGRRELALPGAAA